MRKLMTITFAILLVSGTMVYADTTEAIISITIANNDVDWCNLQSPGTGSFYTGDEFLVVARVNESGITESAGQGSGIYAWIGYSETNNDPSSPGWTWVSASYNGDNGNDDEYKIDLGTEISSAGTYYVASRFSLDNSTYKYGGYSGGFWDGSSNVNAEYAVTVNSDPVLATIGNQTLTEDISEFIELSATDAENDSISYSVSGGSASTVLATVSHDTLFLTPAHDYFTSEAISITITAADAHGSDSETIEVTVANVNDAPVIASIADQSGSEGSELTFSLSATDVDNNVLTWSSANLPAGSSFTDNADGTATFSWTPTYTQAGTYTNVQFIVNDGQGGRSVMRVSTGR